MRAPRAVIALLAFSLLLAGVIAPAVGASDGAASTTTTAENGSSTPSIERPDPHTIITVNVTDDGDARWIVTSRFVVETANETAAFGALSETVANGGTELGYSVETFRRAATLSERSTGRQMAIENATWTSRVENGTGTLSLRFTWTNFARIQSDRLVVDDAFSNDGGTWLPWLADGQKLVINPPAEYAPIDTPPDRGPVNGSLIWNGPREFDPGYFSIVYVPSMGPSGPTTTSNVPPSTTPGSESQQTSPLFWFGVVLLVVAVGAGGYFYAAQRREDGSTPGSAAEAESKSETGTRATTESDDAATTETADETARPAQSAAAGEVDTRTTTADVDDSEPEDETEDGIDPELLSDEERVERLLERNGGRMKQANIVKETGWSNAKVSQLLSSMAEEDRINKLRIGRENLITLPDEDVTDF